MDKTLLAETRVIMVVVIIFLCWRHWTLQHVSINLRVVSSHINIYCDFQQFSFLISFPPSLLPFCFHWCLLLFLLYVWMDGYVLISERHHHHHIFFDFLVALLCWCSFGDYWYHLSFLTQVALRYIVHYCIDTYNYHWQWFLLIILSKWNNARLFFFSIFLSHHLICIFIICISNVKWSRNSTTSWSWFCKWSAGDHRSIKSTHIHCSPWSHSWSIE